MCFARADVFFEEHRGISKGAARLAASLIEQGAKVGGLFHHAHPASAAAESRLDDEREADALGDLAAPRRDPRPVLRCRAAWGRSAFCASARAATLSPIRSSRSERGPTKMIPASSHARAKRGVLRKKSVAGMDHIHALFLRQGDDALNVEIRAHRSFVGRRRGYDSSALKRWMQNRSSCA